MRARRRRSCGPATARFPAGSIVVPLAQPAGRLVRNLLDPRVTMDEAFVKEQDRRRKKRLPDEIYDVTAWSLPLVFDVECVGTGARSGDTRPYDPRSGRPSAGDLLPAKVAWLLPWGTGTAAAVAEALQAGLKVRVAEGGFTTRGARVPGRAPRSSACAENPAERPGDAGPASPRRHRAEAVAVDSGYVEDGVSLGSWQGAPPAGSPACCSPGTGPTSSLSAGWARWVLERRYGQPVTAVRVSSLGRVDLDALRRASCCPPATTATPRRATR